MKNKKIIYLIILITIIIIVIFLTLLNYNNKQINIQKINDDTIIYPYYSNNSKLLYIDNKNYYWYEIDLNNNQKIKLLDEKILGIEKINYKEDGTNAIIYSNYPEYNIKYYNFIDKKNYTLNKNILDVVWNNKNLKIFYIFNKISSLNEQNTEDSFNISEANYLGENYKIIKDLSKTGYLDINIYNSNDDNFIYYQPIIEDKEKGSSLYKLFVNTKQDELITKENIVFSNIVFSPDKSKILFINQNNELILQNINDKNSVKVIYQNIDRIEQVVWSNNNSDIYALVDFDKLIKINTKNNKQQEIKITGEGKIDELTYTIKNLGLSQDNKVLYFTYNNYLYKILLK